MVRPVRTLPCASFSVTAACAVCPTLRDDGSVRSIDATLTDGAETTSEALPDLPSALAVTVTVPALSAVTRPVALTEATVTSELLHPTERSVRTLPFASFSVAVACVDCPATNDGALSATTTDATEVAVFDEPDVTVTGTTDLRPSAFAVISAVPCAIVVTTPASLTIATFEFEVPQPTLRPVIGSPFTS